MTDNKTTYNVTPEGCTCPDAKRSQGICKHQWASIGYAVAVALLALRNATTTAQINEIMETVAAPSISLPLGFRRTLNAEYEQALKDATTAWAGYGEWSKAIEAPAAPVYFHKECTHADCKTTHCNYDTRIGGIAV